MLSSAAAAEVIGTKGLDFIEYHKSLKSLESLGLPLMSFDVPSGIFCESFPFEHRGIEK